MSSPDGTGANDGPTPTRAKSESAAVAAFLRANPGWLSANPELYSTLEPPRRLHGEPLADHMAAMLAQSAS